MSFEMLDRECNCFLVILASLCVLLRVQGQTAWAFRLMGLPLDLPVHFMAVSPLSEEHRDGWHLVSGVHMHEESRTQLLAHSGKSHFIVNLKFYSSFLITG